MDKYQAPAGFSYDAATGKYIKTELVMDTNGKRLQHVLYFDAQTGSYEQAFLPENFKLGDGEKKAKKPRKWLKVVLALVALYLLLCVVTVFVRKASVKDIVFHTEAELMEKYDFEAYKDSTVDVEPYYGEMIEWGIVK